MSRAMITWSYLENAKASAVTCCDHVSTSGTSGNPGLIPTMINMQIADIVVQK